jgi:hypothetical protein
MDNWEDEYEQVQEFKARFEKLKELYCEAFKAVGNAMSASGFGGVRLLLDTDADDDCAHFVGEHLRRNNQELGKMYEHIYEMYCELEDLEAQLY